MVLVETQTHPRAPPIALSGSECLQNSDLWHHDEHGLVSGFCFRTMIVDGIPEIMEIMMRKINL